MYQAEELTDQSSMARYCSHLRTQQVMATYTIGMTDRKAALGMAMHVDYGSQNSFPKDQSRN